jgi:hypothetical protein
MLRKTGLKPVDDGNRRPKLNPFFSPEYPGPGYAPISRKWKFAWCKQVIPVTYITLVFPVTSLGL